jgi:hypothetical protein
MQRDSWVQDYYTGNSYMLSPCTGRLLKSVNRMQVQKQKKLSHLSLNSNPKFFLKKTFTPKLKNLQL